MSFIASTIIPFILVFTALSAVAMLFVPVYKNIKLSRVSAILAFIVFALTCFVCLLFENSNYAQFLCGSISWLPELNFNIYRCADTLSIIFILMAAIGLLVTAITVNSLQKNERTFYFCLFFEYFALFGLFTANDIVSFFAFWQFSVLPIFIQAGLYGRQWRIEAVKKFFVFNCFAALLFAICIFIILKSVHYSGNAWVFSFVELQKIGIEKYLQLPLFLLLLPSCFAHLPVFPFHSWFNDLVEENNNAANILLASGFALSGVFFFVKIIYAFVPLGLQLAAPYILPIFALGVIYSALLTWSYAHIQSAIAGLISINFSLVFCVLIALPQAADIAVFHTVSVALAAAVLYVFCYIVENKRKTVVINDLSGLSKSMPYLSLIFLLALMSLAGLPCLMGFAGIYSMLFVFAGKYPISTVLILTGLMLAFLCALRIIYKVLFVVNYKNRPISNLMYKEFFLLLPIILFLVYSGMKPQSLKNYISSSPILQIAGENHGAH